MKVNVIGDNCIVSRNICFHINTALILVYSFNELFTITCNTKITVTDFIWTSREIFCC